MISLDANAVIGLMKAESKQLRRRFREALIAGEPIVVSSIVLFELRFGIAKSLRQEQDHERLQKFLSGPLVRLAFDDEDAIHAGNLRATLAAAGTPISPYDLMIAGQALRHGARLVTANLREFGRVAGLKVEDWGK